MKRKQSLTRYSVLLGTVVLSLIMAGCASTSNMVSKTKPVGRAHYINHQTVCQKYYTKNDPNNVVGTLVGGALGGLVGNQFGDGTGRSAATAAGSVGGALAGHAIENRANRGHYRTKCHAVRSRRHTRRHRTRHRRRYYRHHHRSSYHTESQ